MFVGAWRDEKGVFSVVGTIAAVVSTAFAAWQILKVRPTVAKEQYKLQQLESEQLTLVAMAAADSATTLRIYWVGARKDVDLYRSRARRSRRASNVIQWTIIIGSAAATSLTAVSAGTASANGGFKAGAAALSLIVTVAASAGGFFKFRDRSVGQQQAADSIEKEIKASELRIGDYAKFADDDQEVKALQLFAERIEAIKDEQRKRELQLEQSSESKEGRTA